jgi:hypothetical protein
MWMNARDVEELETSAGCTRGWDEEFLDRNCKLRGKTTRTPNVRKKAPEGGAAGEGAAHGDEDVGTRQRQKEREGICTKYTDL